jgi:uncharacterized protein (TIGR02594 family)
MTADLVWMKLAKSYLGLKEGEGAANNPEVLKLYALAGHPEVKSDSVAWCAAFVSAVLQKVKLKNPQTLWALDYATWGQPLDRPYYGCIAVKKRQPSGGHVGFCVGANKAQIFLLAGNQGDAVTIAAYPRKDAKGNDNFVAFRWPSEIKIPTQPIDLPTTIAGVRSNLSEA